MSSHKYRALFDRGQNLYCYSGSDRSVFGSPLRAYLSGPMTGLPGCNYHTFNDVAGWLRSLGWFIHNPAENFNGELNRNRADYMRLDIAHLLDVEAVIRLPGWKDSKGAVLENAIAAELGLVQLDYTEAVAMDTLGV